MISICWHRNHTYVAASTGNLQLLSKMVSMAITLLKNYVNIHDNVTMDTYIHTSLIVFDDTGFSRFLATLIVYHNNNDKH